jgi:hypothetical protein
MNNHTNKTCRKRPQDSSYSANTTDVKTASSSTTDVDFAFTVGARSAHPKPDEELLLVDCGATAHIVTDERCFIKMDPSFRRENHTIELADGSRQEGVAVARGDALLKLNNKDNIFVKVLLKDSLLVPTYPCNILSVQASLNGNEHGTSIHFSHDLSYLETKCGTKFLFKKRGRLFDLIFRKCMSDDICVNACVGNVRDLQTWHMVMGHCNIADVLKLPEHVVGMKVSDPKSELECSVCREGKMCHIPVGKQRQKAEKPLQLVHTDLNGPITPVSRGGYQFAICFVDDYSGMKFHYFLILETEE